MTRFFAAVMALALLATSALAQNSAPNADLAQAAADQQATVNKVERYLNAITTLQARFTQTNADGTVQAGTFSLWRPGRLRFQYDPPNGDYIVADGLLIHYWDDAVKNYSNATIGSTLADFLLRKHITLSGDIHLQAIRRPQPGLLVLTLVQRDNPDGGDLRLLFAENGEGVRLDKWRVTNATGQITEVALSAMQTGIRLEPTLFRFKPPKGFDKDWQNTR